METTREEIVLAALLHDIGKFWQRADKPYADSEVLAKLGFNQKYDTLVPVYDNGNPKYVHALWTYAFFQQYDTHRYLQLDSVSLTHLSARHHKPGSMLEGFVSLADRWSSGIDRPDEGEEADSKGYHEVKKMFGADFVRKVPMFSIFDTLLVHGKKGMQVHHFPLAEMDVRETASPVFPGVFDENTIPNNGLQQEYAVLWEHFAAKYRQLPRGNFRAFYQALVNLLKEYTWCIPSATNFLPANVSLFEHLKTTAALAICLYDHYAERPESWDKNNNWLPYISDERDPVQMVCIKFSGIQKFIYDITSSKAAKSLKGRSFYLQLLMRSIIHEVLLHPDIDLYPSNIIYASGGKCYLLLPNTDKVNAALEQIRENLEKRLWATFKNTLYVAFGKASFRYLSFKNTNNRWESRILSSDPKLKDKPTLELGDLWASVNQEADKQKNRRHLSLLLDPHSFAHDFFPKRGIPYQADTIKCAVTGERHLQEEMKKLEKEDPDSPDVTALVYEQTTLGKKLREGTRILEMFRPEVSAAIDIFPGDLATGIKLIPERGTLPYISGRFLNQIWLNRFPDHFPEAHQGYETLFYGGNEFPLNADESVKSFEELAAGTKLGFLKMDVDNLGSIFIHGFEEQNKSFAGYATLSMLLDAFFGGYINTIRNAEAFRDHIQILYSGGDDLFAVGKWDAIIDFAAAIRKEFHRFTGRADLSISGGVAIVGPKFPVSKAAELAGEAEEKAKSFLPTGVNPQQAPAKNAFCFFDETVSWDTEFDFVQEIKDKFIAFDGAYGKNLLHKLQQFKTQKDDFYQGKATLAYKWHSAYYLARTRENTKDPDCREFVQDIRDNILHNATFGADRYLDLVALGSRWAEYTLKNK